MSEKTNNGTTLLFGREFTTLDLWIVTETVHRFPNLSQTELANTICENLQWVAPNGRNKVESCIQLLEKLNLEGKIKLPEKQKPGNKTSRRVVPTAKTDAPVDIMCSLADVGVELKPVLSKSEVNLWNQYVERYHILGYRQPFGAHQRYFILSRDERYLGCILFSAAAWALEARDKWIGWTQTDRSKRLNLVVNNTRFLIFPWVHVKNLASKSLSLAVSRISYDWQSRYGYSPVLLETFVDPEEYRGTCYKAANWILLGETAGRGRMDRRKQYLSTPKHIYVYPLHRDFRAILGGESGDAQ
ncbi:DUF4338 domain-containing protein [Desulfitibacter alkalitolerans]|uniref:DUF4338 domain-containing protein n=1 Tax=Desulfitibacter alkalitolerans TaxID=264641 RepID=UPI000485D551|nr:DUF4338 domain-containing protein [Desulfitibacter alkalitolerans]